MMKKIFRHQKLKAWQKPVLFSGVRYPALDGTPYPPARPIITPQLFLWRQEPHMKKTVRLRRQHAPKFR